LQFGRGMKKTSKLSLQRDTLKNLVGELAAVDGGRGTSISIRTTFTGTGTMQPTRQTCDVLTCLA
jgi:hypothetical protein